MKALFDGIYGLFTGDPTPSINTTLDGQMWPDEAPQNTSRPYAVFFDAGASYGFQFTEESEEIAVQFNAYADTRAEIETIRTQLTALFDWCEASITVTGYTCTWFKREFARSFPSADPQEGKMQLSVLYRVRLEKN